MVFSNRSPIENKKWKELQDVLKTVRDRVGKGYFSQLQEVKHKNDLGDVVTPISVRHTGTYEEFRGRMNSTVLRSGHKLNSVLLAFHNSRISVK